jgi:hypothetical protein
MPAIWLLHFALELQLSAKSMWCLWFLSLSLAQLDVQGFIPDDVQEP